MKTLQRHGKKDVGTTPTSYSLVDNLTMTYNGNQLNNVTDAIANFSYGESADFKDKPGAGVEYTFNKNGAMSKDLNKGITEIHYNSLNLPRQMVINSSTAKAKNYYTYSASGVKLKTEQRYDPALQKSPVGTTTPANDGLDSYKITDYVGNKIYEETKESGKLTNKTRILIDGGYIEDGIYHFYQTDHLGNNRVVANASGTVIQKNHYYPFGMAFAEGTTAEQGKQPYKFGGKELDQMHGVNLYDFSARQKDGERFTTVDPLAEKYYSWSPYVYCGNNPMRAIDPTGKLVVFINGMSPKPWVHGGTSEYWEGFDKAVMEHLRDNNAMYLNGGVTFKGGGDGFFNYANSRIASKRYGTGYYMGKAKASGIFNSLSKNETIKTVSYSMGGAYSKGFIQALVEYMEENGIDPSVIAYEANFAPYQPSKQKAVSKVKTLQYSHNNDVFAGNEPIEGAEQIDTSSDKNQGHFISSFMEQVKNLPSGNYRVVDGKIVAQ